MRARAFATVLALLLATALGAWATGGKEATPSDRVAFSWGWIQGEDVDTSSDFYKFFSDKFKVDVTFVPIPWGDRTQQVNILVASGDMPDITFYEALKAQYTEWAKTGVIREFPLSRVDSYASLKNLKGLLSTAIQELSVDGKLYSWPKFNGANKFTVSHTDAYVYRRDWAEKLGMAKDVYTWNEFKALARAFVQKDPGGNGAGKTVGIAEDVYFPSIMLAFNPYYNAFQKVNGKYVWGPAQASTLTGLLEAKQLYDDGTYWQDFYTAKQGDALGQYAAGLAGIHYENFPITNLDKWRADFKAGTKADPVKGMAFMPVRGADGKFFGSEAWSYWSVSIFSPKVNDATMTRLLQIMDWFAGTEGSYYTVYGMKGTDWTEAGGKVTLNWAKDAAGKLTPPVLMTQNSLRGMALLKTDLDYYNPFYATTTVDDVSKYLKLKTPAQTSFRNWDLYQLTFSGPNFTKYGPFAQEWSDEVKKLIVSSRDFATDYKAWLATMTPRVQPILDELNAGMSK